MDVEKEPKSLRNDRISRLEFAAVVLAILIGIVAVGIFLNVAPDTLTRVLDNAPVR
jgi:hypothetical protein